MFHRTATRPRHIILALLAALLGVTIGLAAIAPTSALAAAGGVPPGLGYSGGGSGGHSTTPPPTSTPPGGTYTPPPAPSGWRWAYDSEPCDKNSSSCTYADYTCTQTTDGRNPIGITLTLLVQPTPDSRISNGYSKVVSHSCNYPPASTVHESTVTCPVRVSGSVVGPSGPGAAPSHTIASVDKQSAWAAGGMTAPSCDETLEGAVQGTTLAQGWWALSWTYSTITATVRTFDNGQTGQVVALGPLTTYPVHQALTVHCALPGGWSAGQVRVAPNGQVLNFATDPDQCRGVQTLGWSCPTPAAVTFDSIPNAGMGTTLDDGTQRAATWASTTLGSDVKNVRGVKTRFYLDSESTPKAIDLQYPPVKFSTSKGGSALPLDGADEALRGDVRTLWVGWQQTSMPGKPSVVHRVTGFTGDFPQAQVTLTGIDLLTGQVRSSTSVTYVAGTGHCQSADLVMDVQRARSLG